jgi:hypothetical protein
MRARLQRVTRDSDPSNVVHYDGAVKRAGQIVFLAAVLVAVLAGMAVARTGNAEPASKDPYWLGKFFAGMRIAEGSERAGSVSYGDCELPEGEGGCSLPAQVQTTTSCARNPIAIDRLPERVWELRGGGLAVAYGPTAVDIGTGNRTVTVYTNELQLMSAALREVRRRSQPSPEPLPPPVYPKTVLEELKRVTAAAEQVHGVKAIAKATGLARGDVRLRLQVAELLGSQALDGVPVPTLSTARIEELRQLAFQAHEIGFGKTAGDEGITVAKLKAEIARVRGLVGYC